MPVLAAPAYLAASRLPRLAPILVTAADYGPPFGCAGGLAQAVRPGRIGDAAAVALASSPCRVTFSAIGVQPKSASCMKYDTRSHQLLFNWVLAKSPTGAGGVTVPVTYPGVDTTTAKSQAVTITK